MTSILGNYRLIDLVRFALPVLPEVAAPERRIPFREKVLWTFVGIFVFLVMSQIPLYGVSRNISNDPFYWLRVVMASNKGTLMELGITPIVTSSMVMQFLVGAKLINCDQSKKVDKQLYEGAQKLLGLVITFVEATAYVFSGMYGNVSDIGYGNALMIIAQLFISGVIVLIMDEMLNNGHGLGSGISLFIATNTCESIMWQALSPHTINTARGPEFEGAIPAFFHLLYSKSNKIYALKEAFYRSGAPNLTSLIATGIVFLMVIYFQGFRIDIPVKHTRVRGATGNYPIKLFYTSNMPIILHAAFVSNFYFISQLLYKRLKSNLLVNMIGQWQEMEFTGNQVPVGGLAYYISPPNNLLDLLFDPIHSVFYIIFVLVSCAFFAHTWIEVSGSAPKDVAKQLRDSQMMMAGYRDSATKSVLERYIPTAAISGGLAVGALTIIADFMGAIGSGTGILLAVTIIYQLFETISKEQQQMGNAMMAGLLGCQRYYRFLNFCGKKAVNIRVALAIIAQPLAGILGALSQRKPPRVDEIL